MILAIIGAGESSRIKSEGFKGPKHLIKLNGEYLIERIIRLARENGFEKVCCIVNEQEPGLLQYLSQNDFRIKVELIVKTTQSSMHSLFELSPLLMNAPFILATTDSVFKDDEFDGFIRFCRLRKDIDGLLAITDFIDDEKPLCVDLTNDSGILKFSDTRADYQWATGGLYYFSPVIFNEMQYARNTGISRLRNYLRLLLNRGYILKGYKFSKMIDVDHYSDIKKAEIFLATGK